MGGPNPGAELAIVGIPTSTLPYLDGVIGIEIQTNPGGEVAFATFDIGGVVNLGGPPPNGPYPPGLPLGSIKVGKGLRGALTTSNPPAGRLAAKPTKIPAAVASGTQSPLLRGAKQNGKSLRGALKS